MKAVGEMASGELGRLGSGGAEGLLHVALPLSLQKFGMFARLHVNGDDFRESREAISTPAWKLGSNARLALRNAAARLVDGDHRRGAARSHSHHVIVTPHDAKQENE